MKGFSARNLKYMRAFAEAWPEVEFVQGVLAQLPWYHQLALLDKLPGPETRRWYASKAIEHNWSRNVLVIQIEMRLLERSGKAITNFANNLPKSQSDLAQLNFYLTAVDAQVKHPQDGPTIGMLLCKSKNKVVAEYALRDKTQPIGVAEYQLVESLPPELVTNLPSIEQIEHELTKDSINREKNPP